MSGDLQRDIYIKRMLFNKFKKCKSSLKLGKLYDTKKLCDETKENLIAGLFFRTLCQWP